MGHRGGLRTATAVVALGAAALLWLPAPARASSLRVTVNGKRIQLSQPDPRVKDALAAAGIELRVGFMRAVGSGEPVADRVRPPKVFVGDMIASLDRRLGSGDHVRVENGVDFTEPIVEQVDKVPTTGLPDIETTIWEPGAEGVVKRFVGRYSGQVAGPDVVVEPPKPAVPVAEPKVQLSFDDGPDGTWTPQVLDILKAKDVKAVFCLVGVQMRRYPDLVRRIHAEGHTLCNHSEHHDTRMSWKSNAYATAEIEATYNLFLELVGVPPRFYRGPGGGLNAWIIAEAHRLGMRVLSWDTDPGDYRKPGAEAIQNRIALNVGGGSVALLHDGGGDRSQTVAQLPGLIDRLRAEGYSIVP